MSGFELEPLEGERPPFVGGTFFDLATVGYQQHELTLRATARAWDDGPGGLAVVEEAAVATRLLVHRPIDDAAFDGTVVVEWLNVSAGLDAAPLWVFAHRELVRRGSAWIGVSCQRAGVNGAVSSLDLAAASPLVQIDGARYGHLDLPADRFSYDVFTMAGQVARTLDGLPVQRVLAVGESQSAYRLTTYINRFDPLTQVFDGYLVHARGGAASELHDHVDPRRLREGAAVPFRPDLRVPVLVVEAETDLITLGYRDARQDDAERLVVWEMAGTSHADAYTFGAGFADDGLQPIEQLAASWRPPTRLFGQTLDLPVNAGPQHWILDAAVRSLGAWVGDGRRPPAAPRLELEGDGFRTDALGNARGGIRTPHVDVPVAVLSGLGNGGTPMAFLTGSTRPFPRAQLVELYGTRGGYLERFRASAEATVEAGFVLADELEEIVGVAEHNLDLP